MTNIGTLQVTTPSEREIAMARVFDAPRSLVFDAWTKPELLKRWLGARAGWSMAVCEIDPKAGGAYRWVWRGPGGTEMGVSGVYREIVRPEQIVATERFDQAWYPGEAVVWIDLAEQGGKTTLTTTILYESRQARDRALRTPKTPLSQGVTESYDKLAEMLASMLARGDSQSAA